MDATTCYLCMGNKEAECRECWDLEPRDEFNAAIPALWFSSMASLAAIHFLFAWMIFSWPYPFGWIDERDSE